MGQDSAEPSAELRYVCGKLGVEQDTHAGNPAPAWPEKTVEFVIQSWPVSCSWKQRSSEPAASKIWAEGP